MFISRALFASAGENEAAFKEMCRKYDEGGSSSGREIADRRPWPSSQSPSRLVSIRPF
jgi:hypothetical protein